MERALRLNCATHGRMMPDGLNDDRQTNPATTTIPARTKPPTIANQERSRIE